MLRMLLLGLLALLLGGCASYGVVANVPGLVADDEPSYSIRTLLKKPHVG